LASEGEYDDEFTDSPRVKIMLDWDVIFLFLLTPLYFIICNL
jgi:hypothetical protein